MKDDLALGADEQQAAAAKEFEGLVEVLRRAGVEVLVFDDTSTPPTPDSIFPNNWISSHPDGSVVLYPMQAENRRTERRMDVVEALSSQHGFTVSRVTDLSRHEAGGHFLEGTGSLVLDRMHKVAYACVSPRTHLDVLGDFAQQLDYDVVTFDAQDRNGVPIYHTNVMMAHGDGFVVICDESIRDEAQRKSVRAMIEQCGQEVISIDFAQMEAFAGNMLELENGAGSKILAMSTRARASLTDEQLGKLRHYAQIVAAPIDLIEDSAGGSVRCMLAEVFLPKRDE